MVKRQNYGFEKRQKDLKKQQKREEKSQKKRLRDEPLDAEVQARVEALCAEGRDLADAFRQQVPEATFHPFFAANYDVVLKALMAHRGDGLRFLEWGSGTGVITIMAELLGFEAFGIELDERLVTTARALATAQESNSEFAVGSFLPAGYEFSPPDGDGRTATIGNGPPGYPAIGHNLEDFDVVFAYPWGGEEPMMIDLMKQRGNPSATLLLHTVTGGIVTYQDGGLR